MELLGVVVDDVVVVVPPVLAVVVVPGDWGEPTGVVVAAVLEANVVDGPGVILGIPARPMLE